MLKLVTLGYLLGDCCAAGAQAAGNGVHSLFALPENELAQHDFLYAGESPDRKIFIVRQGKVVWNYDDPAGKGEVSETVMLSNGNVMFTHQFGVTETTPEKKVIWNYDAPAGH